MARGKNTPLNQRSRLANGLPSEVELPDDTEHGIVVRDSDGNIQLTYWADKDGDFHREGDRPAVLWADGSKEWYHHGKRHRISNPAVVKSGGETQTWIKGCRLLAINYSNA
jgi:hypothetical protein